MGVEAKRKSPETQWFQGFFLGAGGGGRINLSPFFASDIV